MMGAILAPFFLVLWNYSGGTVRTIELPQASQAVCEANGHKFTQELGWHQDWDGYQCISTGYPEERTGK